MAQATTFTFSKVRVLLGNGASPELFAAPCGFNSRSLRRTKTTNEVDIPDCSDEDAPAWVGREVRSLDWNVTGEGVLAEESVSMWEDFFDSSTSRNVQVIIDGVGITGGDITLLGRAHLTSYEIGANRGEKATISIELSGDGELARQ